MFDVGFWELVVLFGLGLIILGPERLPKVAMQVGSWVGQARRMARHLSGQIRTEMNEMNATIDGSNPGSSAAAGPAGPQYSRPGADDLKPSSPQSASPAGDEESPVHSPDSSDIPAGKAD